jgi:hypothetical protein
MEVILIVFKMSIVELFYLVGLIILTGLILGLCEGLSNNFLQKSFMGERGVFITAWLGTPVHEIGHAVMCIVFKHEVIEMKLLNTRSESGVLGYVNHRYNPTSIYQSIGNLFIGLGPIYSGIASLITLMYLLIPNTFTELKNFMEKGIDFNKVDSNLITGSFKASTVLIKNIFTYDNLVSLRFWIFIAAAICISSHMALSKADMKGALHGLIVLFIMIFIVTFMVRYFGVSTERYTAWIMKYNTHLTAFLIVALVFSSITLIFSLLCYMVTGIIRKY